jgi:hypothetical protein
MPVDAKLGMSHASTKETVAIGGLFSLRQKNTKPKKGRTEPQIEPHENSAIFPPDWE